MESNQSTHEIFLHQHFGHMVFQISFPKILLLKIKNFCPSYILIFLQSLLSFLQTIYLLYHLMETLLVYPQEKCQLFHIVNLNLQTIHNPTLLGLLFSILNQFTNTSDFVSNRELISLNNSDGKFELQGKTYQANYFVVLQIGLVI